ncbi:suppressor of fused domain protein [Duganella sp. HH105]|uniref:suppressor of fused domain protein n=1 Tax=Duganella sp. HH105 TaxID=1781067 RepID=UPI000877B08A|nr:suppressor of fused domain protein [Duganella sp. HH105]OEZ62660.1 suppressor of fused protein (SUFU) [Duganella sp. HH105]
MEKIFEEVWREALEQRFGVPVQVAGVKMEAHPRMLVYYFNDFPTKGMLTAVTAGLSSANRPEWVHGKPELMFSLRTTDPNWGSAAALLAQKFFQTGSFAYQSCFKLDAPMSGDSAMNACFVYKPFFLEGDQLKFELPDRTIYLAGLYPMYDEEVSLYETNGLQAFWETPGYDYLNPRRASLAKR